MGELMGPSTTPPYILPSVTSTLLGGNYNWQPTTSYNHIEDEDRKTRLLEMESLVRMYTNLKDTNLSVLKSMEETIARYMAELFYLEPNKQYEPDK